VGSTVPLFSSGLEIYRECQKTYIFVITELFKCRMCVLGAVTAITLPVLIFRWILGECSSELYHLWTKGHGVCFVCIWHAFYSWFVFKALLHIRSSPPSPSLLHFTPMHHLILTCVHNCEYWTQCMHFHHITHTYAVCCFVTDNDALQTSGDCYK
jgi:hypothetical protein